MTEPMVTLTVRTTPPSLSRQMANRTSSRSTLRGAGRPTSARNMRTMLNSGLLCSIPWRQANPRLAEALGPPPRSQR